MANDFLGRGWRFPVGVDAAGNIAMSAYEQDIREAIELILGTSRGERAMRPDFGGGLQDFVFERITVTNLGRIQSAVFDSLVKYEQRIQVISVDVAEDRGNAGTLLIEVDYRVRATNTKFNVVFPFYLQERS